MLKTEAKLIGSPLNEDKLEHISMMEGFYDGLIKIAGNESAVFISTNLPESERKRETTEKFKNRFFEMGSSEQTAVSTAAGMGVSGNIPVVGAGLAQQIGKFANLDKMLGGSNVKFVACGGNADEMSFSRPAPGIHVFVPCDAKEMKKALMTAVDIFGPVYIQCPAGDHPIFTADEAEFVPGKSEVLWESESPEVAIVACGPIVHKTLIAAKELEENEGVGSIVINNSTINSPDIDVLLDAIDKVGAVVTVEEHSVEGGLGCVVSKVLAGKHPTPMEFVGVVDGPSGSEKSYDIYELNVDGIKKAAKRAIARK